VKKSIVALFLSLTILILVACTSQSADPTEEITETLETIVLSVSGSGSVTPVLSAIADDFEATNPGYALEILPGSGTGGGVQGVIDGALDLAAMSRPARDTEEGVLYTQIGTSVTAIYTHPDVGVTELTSEQLTDIFTGTVTNWSEVGGEDLDIVVYVRDPEEGNTVDIRETFIGDAEFSDTTPVLTSQTDMQNSVSSVEGAIGYGTWSAALANEANVVSLTIDGIGVDNSPETMTTSVGIGYLAENEANAQVLIDWLFSEDGRSVLATIAVTVVEVE